MSEVTALCKTRLRRCAECACGVPVRSWGDLYRGVPNMRIQSISEYTLKWNFRHPGSFTYKSLRALENLGMDIKMIC